MTPDGGDSDGTSHSPSLSTDARYVTFTSEAGNLVPGDRNGRSDIFVRDLVAGTTVRASVDTGGGDPNGESVGSAISADGRYVAFASSAGDLIVGDQNGLGDVFVRDMVAGATIRASVDARGGDPNGESFTPSISADGRVVGIWSSASDLVPQDEDRKDDVFVVRWR